MREQEIEQLIETEAREKRQALEHIRSLVSSHDAELRRWSTRQRRRETVSRTVLAVCIFFGACFFYSSAMAKPLYDQITKTGQSDNHHVFEKINSVIEKSQPCKRTN